MTGQPLLQRLTRLCTALQLPTQTGAFTDSPAPASFVVLTPIADVFDLHAANTAGVQIEHVRLSLFTTGNYLPLRDALTRELGRQQITVEARTYVGYEAETGYHHYAIDCAAWQLTQI
ncbi:hypothetical protein [Rothia sp. 32237D007AR]